MALRLGHLTVPSPVEYERTASGVVLPRLFFSGLNELGTGQSDLTDYRAQLRAGRRIRFHRGLACAVGIPKGFGRDDWERHYAVDYRAACERLDATPAAQRARDLLFDFLSPDQRRTAERDRFIELTLYHPEVLEDSLEARTATFRTIRFRFWRGFPNGNILFGEPRDQRYSYRMCLHPVTPFPTDDVVLSQIIGLMTDPDEFISRGHITQITDVDTYSTSAARQTLLFNRMFAPRERTRVIVSR